MRNFRNTAMIKKRFNKKGQGAILSYRWLIKILLIIIVAGILYFMLRRIGNAFLPR